MLKKLFLVALICNGIGGVMASSYNKTFTLTAYYSPLQNQSFYLTGSYEAERRLNGAGIYGASGVGVYPGMLAAPSNYKFGTKIKFKGIGVGTVTDRGGAIVNKGSRNAQHDRIDVWMGYGEPALRRAIRFGKRDVRGVILRNNLRPDTIDFNKFPAQGVFDANTALARKNLYFGATGQEVKNLQRVLFDLGLWTGDKWGSFDQETKKAVIKFQMANHLLNKSRIGAGNYGPSTRRTLIKVYRRYQDIDDQMLRQAILERSSFLHNLTAVKYARRNGDILRVAKKLQEWGYLKNTPSSYYGHNLTRAIVAFQRKNGIIKSARGVGIGVFGPSTRREFLNYILTKSTKNASVARTKLRLELFDSYLVAYRKNLLKNSAKMMNLVPRISLTKHSRGIAVSHLQQALRSLGYFKLKSNGIFGPATINAVITFQIANKIVKTPYDNFAGVFGPSTRRALNAHLVANVQRSVASLVVATRKDFYQKWQSLYARRFVFGDLTFGKQSNDVVYLQQFLQKQGDLQREPTGFFGYDTARALSRFERRHFGRSRSLVKNVSEQTRRIILKLI